MFRDLVQVFFTVILTMLCLACSDRHWLDLNDNDVIFVFENVDSNEQRLLKAIMYSAVSREGDELEIRSSRLEKKRLAFAYKSGLKTNLEKNEKMKKIMRMLKDTAPDCNYKLIVRREQ